MLDYISGYKTFGYEELTDYHLRINHSPIHTVKNQIWSKKLLNRLGHSFVHFGQWLIRLTELPKSNLENTTHICSHCGE